MATPPRRSLTLLATAVLLAAGLASCGRPAAGPSSTAGPGPTARPGPAGAPATGSRPGRPVVGAVFDGGGLAVVITQTGVSLSTDAGRSWRALRLAAEPAAGHSIARAGAAIAAITAGQHGLSYQRSVDRGRSWAGQLLAGTGPAERASVALSADGTRTAVLASAPGGVGNAPAQLFVATSGQALVPRPAPVSGTVAWQGNRLLVAGGPLSSQLYASDDSGASWRQLAVGGRLAPRFNVDPGTPSIGAPLRAPDGSVVLPVTTHSAAGSSVLLYSSAGNGFALARRVALHGVLGPGAVAAVGATGAGSYLIAEPTGSDGAQRVTLHLVGPGSDRTIQPAGLQGTVDSLTFQDTAHGLAQVTRRGCGSSKQTCSENVQVLQTTDGGLSWQPSGG